MILDPTARFQPNKLGVTVGLTFHTPKYSKCEPEAYLASQFDEMRYPDPLDEETLEDRFLYWWYHKQRCKKKRHLNYRGYMYWTGPKRRYDFRYMGATHPRERWWKPFSVSKNGRYTRWFDNGPQNPPRNHTLSAEDIRLLEPHIRKFREALESSRQQMHEYIRVRGFRL